MFMHTQGLWEGVVVVNAEDYKWTSSTRDVCPRYHHPYYVSLGSDTTQEEKKSGRGQYERSWKKLFPYSQPLRPRPSTGGPEEEFMIN